MARVPPPAYGGGGNLTSLFPPAPNLPHAVGGGGVVPGRSNVTPGWWRSGPNVVPTGGGGETAASLPGGGLTLDALMAREKELKGSEPQMGQMISPLQGVSYALQQALSGFQEGRAHRDVAQASNAVTGALGRLGPAGEQSPEDAAALAHYSPDTFLELWKARQTAANQEHWRPATAEELQKYPGLDATKGYEISDKTNQLRAIGGGGVTINPPSADIAGKLGLTEGFTDNYDAVLKSIDAGELTGLNWIGSVGFGRGSGGVAYRNIRQGTEGLIRLLTGAGMSVQEAQERVTSYEPAMTDDAPTLRNKVVQLKQALDNVTDAVKTRGNKAAAADPDLGKPGHGTPAPAPDPNNPPAPAPDSATPAPPKTPALTGKDWGNDPKKVDLKALKPGDVFMGTVFIGGDPTDDKNWVVKPAAPAAAATPAPPKKPAAAAQPGPGGLY